MQQSVPGARAMRAGRLCRAATVAASLWFASAGALAAPPQDGAAASPAPSTDGAGAPKAERVQEKILIQADRLIVKPGVELTDVRVLVENGVIRQVGKRVNAPEGAREIKGKVVCAAFIDPWSSFGVDFESLGEQRNSPAVGAADGLDGFIDPRVRKDVLRSGVTVVRTQVGLLARISGTSSVLRLHPSLEISKALITPMSSLMAALGVRPDGNGSDPFERLADVERLASMIGQGENYAQERVEYQHEFAEWSKKIADKQKELDEGFKKAKKDRDKEVADAKEKGKEFKEKEFKEDAPPKKPKFDAEKEVLAKVAEGEIALMVEVHRASQLRALLDATEGFGRLRLVLAGATDALEVAPELARRKIPVVVWPQPMGRTPLPEMERHDLALAGRLRAAGVTVLLGSGARTPGATRDLPLLAQMAIGSGLDRDAAFAALTIQAARVLDLDARLGSVEQGKDADLLVLDGEPLAGGTRVEYVLSGGDVVITPEDR